MEVDSFAEEHESSEIAWMITDAEANATELVSTRSIPILSLSEAVDPGDYEKLATLRLAVHRVVNEISSFLLEDEAGLGDRIIVLQQFFFGNQANQWIDVVRQ